MLWIKSPFANGVCKITVRGNSLGLLAFTLFLAGCEKPNYHVPAKLEKVMVEAGCKPETDFYKGDQIYPANYQTSFLSIPNAGVTVSSALVRCKKEDGLYFLFHIEPARKEFFPCEKMVKYPLADADGGIAIIQAKFSSKIFKPLGDAPVLADADVDTKLYGLRRYADDEATGLFLTCIDGHWYKTELD